MLIPAKPCAVSDGACAAAITLLTNTGIRKARIKLALFIVKSQKTIMTIPLKPFFLLHLTDLAYFLAVFHIPYLYSLKFRSFSPLGSFLKFVNIYLDPLSLLLCNILLIILSLENSSLCLSSKICLMNFIDPL
uniref:Uncharacterized protein ORF-c21_032 n=1 Tax=Saccharolobus solfataricus TaxID=2287 RepID=Q9UWX0_SACSO|nr:hypothetical protein [Saccharolobus solfataricus P2]